MRTATTLPLIATFALLAAACTDGTGPSGTPQLALSFSVLAVPPAAIGADGPQLAADTLGDGTNELVISKVEIVLREVELERLDDDACEGAVDHDDCEEFAAGPLLLDLPLGGSIDQLVTISPDTGTYDEIEFEIHKVSSDDPEDAAFRDLHPDLIGTSIRVQGTFNGQSFTYETDLDVEQETAIAPPLVVTEAGADLNVTVRVDLNGWFRNGAGALLDPATGNEGGANEGLIQENIKQSFEAFEDDDHDGDHDESDDD